MYTLASRSRRIRSSVGTIVIMSWLGACSGRVQGRDRPLRAADWSCISPESLSLSRGDLRYSDLDTAKRTQDESGAVLTLYAKGGGPWGGSLQVAEGQLGVPRPLRPFKYDSSTHQLEFFAPGGPDTVHFKGVFSCAEVRGVWVEVLQAPDSGVILRRSR
jgi:hypothetical protein